MSEKLNLKDNTYKFSRYTMTITGRVAEVRDNSFIWKCNVAKRGGRVTLSSPTRLKQVSPSELVNTPKKLASAIRKCQQFRRPVAANNDTNDN